MAKASKDKAKRLQVKMIASLIGCTDKQRATVRGIGLRRIHQVVEREDTAAVRGMVAKVPHLVAIVTEQG